MTYLLKVMNQLLQKMMIHLQQENDRGLLLAMMISTRIPRRKKRKDHSTGAEHFCYVLRSGC